MTTTTKKEEPVGPPPTLLSQFVHYAKVGNAELDGTKICLSQSDRWMKQALVFSKKLTTTDTGLCFNKFKTRTLKYDEYEKFLMDLSRTKNVDYNAMIEKMTFCGAPLVIQNAPKTAT